MYCSGTFYDHSPILEQDESFSCNYNHAKLVHARANKGFSSYKFNQVADS